MKQSRNINQQEHVQLQTTNRTTKAALWHGDCCCLKCGVHTSLANRMSFEFFDFFFFFNSVGAKIGLCQAEKQCLLYISGETQVCYRAVLPAASAFLQMVKHVDYISYPPRLLLDLRGEVNTRPGHHLMDKMDINTRGTKADKTTTPSHR